MIRMLEKYIYLERKIVRKFFASSTKFQRWAKECYLVSDFHETRARVSRIKRGGMGLAGDQRKGCGCVRVVINAAAALRAKKAGQVCGASQNQTFLESVYPGLYRCWFDT